MGQDLFLFYFFFHEKKGTRKWRKDGEMHMRTPAIMSECWRKIMNVRYITGNINGNVG